MNYNLQNQITNIYNNDYKFFFYKPNVEGIGYGYKYINETCTCEPSIHIFVSKKVSKGCLNSETLIPTLYRGIKTDIIETGLFTANFSNTSKDSFKDCQTNPINSIDYNAKKTYPYSRKIRPIHPGYSMSTSYENSIYPHTGTLGYVVIDKLAKIKSYCFLSNNSTFSNFNESPIGTSILQPSYNFGGCAPRDKVATLLRFAPLNFSQLVPSNLGKFNIIDASIASYANIRHSELINPLIPNIGIPKEVSCPSLNMSVKWTGCMSGTQYGIIHSINSIIRVNYKNNKLAWFKDISLSMGKGTYSDLGALICNNHMQALGILFGLSSINHVCICSIKNIIDILNVDLLTI